jgi:glycosyltransferase involved in cell wall biosynthesis
VSSQRKTIILLSAFISPFRSGAEAMVEEVAARLGDRYDITIVTGRYDRALPKEAALDGSNATVARERRGNVRVVRVGVGSSIDKYLFPLLGALEVRGRCPVIVHAVLESYAGLALVLSKVFCPRSRRILTLQSTNTSFMLGSMHRAAQTITAISKVLIERAATYGRTDVTLIPNGIPLKLITEAMQFHQKVPGRVLFVGRLEKMKGIDTLLRAFKIVCKDPSIPESVHLHIVGRGSQRDVLKTLSQDLGIQNRVTFVGHLPAAKVYDEYAQAQIFCGLSRSEALGNVFLEAQAAGCAVVATNTGGIPDIVQDGKTGVLVAPEDSEAAALWLIRLLTDQPFFAAVSGEACKDKERYDWNVIAKAYAQIYESR